MTHVIAVRRIQRKEQLSCYELIHRADITLSRVSRLKLARRPGDKAERKRKGSQCICSLKKKSLFVQEHSRPKR